ncbi:MAG TPA: carboxymuconolactone decarboxylase family protein [Nitrososphaera sp.]|nr:carboxymuconolactone decarboxylase family protein [Nitrososphaera sp.]
MSKGKLNAAWSNLLDRLVSCATMHIFGQSAIPPKYREMIGLAVAATLKCPYCETFHRGAAKMYGATEEELEEVGVITGQTAFWSSILHAQNYDIITFTKEFQAMGEKLSKQQQQQKQQSMTA